MPNSSDPEKSLGFVIHDVARLLRRNFNRLVQEFELTQAQWQALAYISRHPGMKQSQLAEILEVQPINVARLIDRMQASGWVERRPDLCDRRALNLFLTEKAKPILMTMRERALESQAQALNGLSSEERQTLLENLLIMRRNLIEIDR